MRHSHLHQPSGTSLPARLPRVHQSLRRFLQRLHPERVPACVVETIRTRGRTWEPVTPRGVESRDWLANNASDLECDEGRRTQDEAEQQSQTVLPGVQSEVEKVQVEGGVLDDETERKDSGMTAKRLTQAERREQELYSSAVNLIAEGNEGHAKMIQDAKDGVSISLVAHVFQRSEEVVREDVEKIRRMFQKLGV